jgi:futalosine hydrolase
MLPNEKKFDADIETMEGAAFFYSCLQLKIPFLQIRAISNFVEPRDKSKWNIPLALENLSTEIFDFLNTI